MKFRYYVMSNAPHKRLPRKAKKRIQRMIKAGYPNKYSSAKVAIQDFREFLKQQWEIWQSTHAEMIYHMAAETLRQQGVENSVKRFKNPGLGTPYKSKISIH